MPHHDHPLTTDPQPGRPYKKHWLSSPGFLSLFFGGWLLVLWAIPSTVSVLSDYYPFSFLGIIGAIFANSTGAGGGVVFIPMFNQLGFSAEQAVATSFGIQCFGMTAGALTWNHFYQHEKRHLAHWPEFYRVIGLCAPCSIAGIWLVYGLDLPSWASLHTVFSYFSIVLGSALLVTVLSSRYSGTVDQLKPLDQLMIALIGLAGGVLTAWLSVGVGEILALYLIFRRFDAGMAVAAAVVVSALTVWSAAPQHFYIAPNVYWQVILFAGPGAVLGGIFAKTLALWMSPRTLKIFFSLWVLMMGLSSAPFFRA